MIVIIFIVIMIVIIFIHFMWYVSFIFPFSGFGTVTADNVFKVKNYLSNENLIMCLYVYMTPIYVNCLLLVLLLLILDAFETAVLT